MSTSDTTAANPYIVHGAALCVSRPVQTHPFLVQGWGMFDRSGHGIAKHHRHTVEWDSNEATWESVEKELDDKYMEGGRSSNPLVLCTKFEADVLGHEGGMEKAHPIPKGL